MVASKHTHTHAQCSNTSVGLTQLQDPWLQDISAGGQSKTPAGPSKRAAGPSKAAAEDSESPIGRPPTGTTTQATTVVPPLSTTTQPSSSVVPQVLTTPAFTSVRTIILPMSGAQLRAGTIAHPSQLRPITRMYTPTVTSWQSDPMSLGTTLIL